MSFDKSGLTRARRNMHWSLVSELAARILSGEFAEGEVLPRESDLLSQYDVSRTLLREALRTLSAKGLVEPRPKTGTFVLPRASWSLLDPDVMAWSFVAKPSPKYARDLMEIRLMIEPVASGLAADRAASADLGTLKELHAAMLASPVNSPAFVDADIRFHGAILAATHNDLLRRMTSAVEGALAASRMLTSNSESGAATMEMHTRVFDAICSRQSNTAAIAMEELVRAAQSDLITVLDRATRPRRGRRSATL